MDCATSCQLSGQHPWPARGLLSPIHSGRATTGATCTSLLLSISTVPLQPAVVTKAVAAPEKAVGQMNISKDVTELIGGWCRSEAGGGLAGLEVKAQPAAGSAHARRQAAGSAAAQRAVTTKQGLPVP